MTTTKPANLEYLSTRDICRFCEIGCRTQTRWFDAPLSETENFVAVPSLGSLVPGWVVVLPRDHSSNFSEHYTSTEFESFLDEIRFDLSEFGERIHIFEHGAQTRGSDTGCGVDHAHVHVVPLPGRISAAVRDVDPQLNWLPVSQSEITGTVLGSEYLAFAESCDRAEKLLRVAQLDSPRSQFFRKSIARMIGNPDKFDYREHPFYENIEQTYGAFRDSRRGRKTAV